MEVDESSIVWSTKRFYLIAFSYTTGPMIPRLTSPWLIRTRVGVLLLLPIQLFLMFIVTVPCVFMELALGQYSSKALIKIWDLCPTLRGIGICSFFMFITFQMYNVFLTNASLVFTIYSIGSQTPYKSCNMSWNKINCFTIEENFTRRSECNTRYSVDQCAKMHWQSSIAQYYFYRVLNIGDKTRNTPDYELLAFTLITMTVIFFANYSGSKSTEKFLILLIAVPTIQLAILFLTPLLDRRGFTSLMYLFTQNDPSRLKNVSIWISMIRLVSSDSGLGFGAYITFGIHGAFRHPILFKSILISLLIFSFTTVYSITVQNLLSTTISQHKMEKEELFALERDLNMPDAVFFLPKVSRFWVTMWLSNVYMLGLRSLIVMMCLTTEIIYNSLPKVRKHHTLVVLLCCVTIYCGVAVFSTRIGYYLYKVIDRVIIEVCLVFINTVKVIGVVYCYGITNFLNDVHFMLGIRLSPYWKIFYVINPLLFGTVLIHNLKIYYEGKRKQPYQWLNIFQHCYIWFNVAIVVVFALQFIIRNIIKKNYKFLEPTKDWGPKDPMLRKSREMFTAHNMTKEYVYRQARFGANRF